jgi:hypothetical protein
MGRGMTEHGSDDGAAVETVVDAAYARLTALDDIWLDFIQAVRW